MFEYKIPEFMDNCPQWWRNFAAHFEEELDVEICDKDLTQYNASFKLLENKEYLLTFPSEEDAIMFVLRWS